MSTKTISITEEAYERLKINKGKHESFSDVINKITNKINILDFAGILKEDEANLLIKEISSLRSLSRKRIYNP